MQPGWTEAPSASLTHTPFLRMLCAHVSLRPSPISLLRMLCAHVVARLLPQWGQLVRLELHYEEAHEAIAAAHGAYYYLRCVCLISTCLPCRCCRCLFLLSAPYNAFVSVWATRRPKPSRHPRVMPVDSSHANVSVCLPACQQLLLLPQLHRHGP